MSDSRTVEPLILLIEDDPGLVGTLRQVLTASGYRLVVAGNGSEARAALEQLEPQLILLDIVLPDADGLVLAATLKKLRAVPIIIVSARARQADRVLGLKIGADDFVAKPFDVEELLARIEAVLRRATPRSPSSGTSDRITIGELTIVRSRALLTVGHQTLNLTPTEYRLLLTLAMRVNDVVSRPDLIGQVWGFADPEASAGHLVDVHMGRLRKKLAMVALLNPRIETMRGRGYSLQFQESAPEA